MVQQEMVVLEVGLEIQAMLELLEMLAAAVVEAAGTVF